MAFSPNTKSSYNARSISLPSRPHPQLPQFEERLSTLKSSVSTSTLASASTSFLIHNLSGLKELYDCLDELLLLQPNQQSLVQFDDHLDASLRLLDVCGSARDSLLKMKESIQSIQSVLRRKGSGETNIGHEVDQYLILRKKIKQMIIKGSLKEIKSVLERSSCDGMLREMEDLTAKIFVSLLSYIASTKDQAKKTKWSLVSKLLQPSRAFDKDEAVSRTELNELDVAIPFLLSYNNIVEAEKLRSKMVNLEAEIQGLEEVLECVFRRLVKTRAILLNILSS